MELKPLNKKGQGVVTGLIGGVAGLIIIVIITLVVVVTIMDADLFEDLRASTNYVNQTVNASKGASFGNTTLWDSTCTVDSNIVWNVTGGETINSGNYTLDEEACTIIFKGVTVTYNGTDLWGINSTTSYAGETERAPINMKGNLTTGINNVSSKIPTILLIGAIVILLTVLGLLMRNMGVMNIGGSGGSL